MLVRFTKNPPGEVADLVTCVRTDGSATSAPMRRQGTLPHEGIHFVVETTLGWHDAMFGRIARGESLETVTAHLHEQGGRWVKITQARQCEALVETLETMLWTGDAEPAAFAEKLVALSRRRGVAPADINAEELERVRVALREFGAAWRPLAPGASVERTFGT